MHNGDKTGVAAAILPHPVAYTLHSIMLFVKLAQ